MRIAFFSDIHGNAAALEAALQVAREAGATRFCVAGDLVGGGPFPQETVDRIRSLENTDVIRGNVDRKVLRMAKKKAKKRKKRAARGGGKSNRAWTTLALTEEALDWLSELPTQLTLTEGDARILLVHGSPWNDTDYIYPSLTADGLRSKLRPHDGPAPSLLVCGHSHIPFTKPVNGTIVVNCGSVGRPADGDARGSLALAEIEEGRPPRVEIVRFTYPVDDVVEAIREREVPGIDPEDYVRGIKS